MWKSKVKNTFSYNFPRWPVVVKPYGSVSKRHWAKTPPGWNVTGSVEMYPAWTCWSQTYPPICQHLLVFTYTVTMINCRSDTHKYTVVDADTSQCSLLNVLELFPLFLWVISEMIISHAYVITGVISRPNVHWCRSGAAQAQMLNTFIKEFAIRTLINS